MSAPKSNDAALAVLVVAGALFSYMVWQRMKSKPTQNAAIPGARAEPAAAPSMIGQAIDKAAELVKRWEGLSLTAYKDIAGKLTIGWGHLVKAGEALNPISAAQAEEILFEDMSSARAAVNGLVRVPLTEGQRAALVSFVFNLGRQAFAGSTLLRKLNAGDYAGAAAQFDLWVYAKDPKTGAKVKSQGLINRRASERATFEKG